MPCAAQEEVRQCHSTSENVSRIAIWWISGGAVGLAGLAWFYYGDQILAAARAGQSAGAGSSGGR